MKRFGALIAGLAALVGLPMLLATFIGPPWIAANDILSSTSVQAPIERAVPIVGLVLWCGWTWIVLATVGAVTRHRQGIDIASGPSSRLIAMFVVALWVTLVPRSSTVGNSVASNESVEPAVNRTQADSNRSVLPLALTASAFAVGHVLRSLGERREARLRVMAVGQQFRAVGSLESAWWRSLLMATRRGSMTNEEPTLGRIPIGTRDGTVLTIAVEPGDSIGIEARVDAEARAVARHAQWMLEDIVGDGSSRPVTIRVGFADGQRVQVAQDDLGWRLVASGERFDAFGVSEDEERMVDRLYVAASEVEEHRPPTAGSERRILVRLMGPVLVESADGSEPVFEKSRSVELLAWLVTHRDRPTRAAARTAMWESDVQNATFNNIVSDLRTGLQAFYDGTGAVGLEKSFDDRLRFDTGIISDADLLDQALTAYIDCGGAPQRSNLRAALRMVREMPFLGADYLWPDPEGITSNIVHLIVSASTIVAEDALERDEFDEVFFATGQGLKVLRNHEGLIGLRMRAYAKRGDLAGVRHEWACYASARDGSWAESELRRLCDELLGIAVAE